MEERILVNVYLPPLYKNFEIFIPRNISLDLIVTHVIEMMEALSEGMYMANEQSVLIDQCSGDVINCKATADEQGLRNGSQLMLI